MSADRSKNLRNDFKVLSMEDKIATLIDLEIMTVAQGLEKIGECTISLANRIFEGVVTKPGEKNSSKEPRPEPQST